MKHNQTIKSIFRGANFRRARQKDRREVKRILQTLGLPTIHQNTYSLRGGI